MPKGEQESAKTHCPKGHPYSAENTRISNGSRFCRQCDNDFHKRKRREGGKIIILNADKTHCPRGHEYSPENTRMSTNGSRLCKACDRLAQLSDEISHPEKHMWQSARCRAQKAGVPFEIKPSDIVIPPCCPVLGIPLKRGTGSLGPKEASPSLDRIIPSLGYVLGNITVISVRANRIKNDATLEELELVTAWMRTITSKG